MALRIDMEMKHFCHKHPLTLIEVKIQLQKKKYESDDQNSICYGCLEPISSEEFAYFCTGYRCEADFCLHKSCAELPPEISHPKHRQHPLLLRQRPLIRDGPCAVCGREWDGFIYECPICFFTVDVRCVLKDDSLFANSSITLEFHEHPLKFNPRPALFFCNVCGAEEKDDSYICTTGNCPFWIHKSCALLPKLKYCNHNHPLSLSYSFPFQYRHFDDLMKCDFCHKEIYLDYWVYYCDRCRYFIHVNCAKGDIPHPRGRNDSLLHQMFMSYEEKRRKRIPAARHGVNHGKGRIPPPRLLEPSGQILQPLGYGDYGERRWKEDSAKFRDIFDSATLPGRDIFAQSKIFVELTRDFLKKYCGSTQELSSEINHFSHVHPLKMMECKGGLICDACILPICDSYYSCEKCSYFLHASCAELPEQTNRSSFPKTYYWRRRIHKGPLKFKSSLSYFNCCICQSLCNGFGYSFSEQINSIDVKCAILDAFTIIKHEAHPHQLVRTHSSQLCNSCKNFDSHSFGCNQCSFYLDYKCVLLPGRINPFETFGGFKQDNHPIILMYPPFSHHPEEFYCEICEEEMHPRFWIYHCSECDRSFHSTCIVELHKYRNIKFGASLQLLSHRHALKFVIRGGFTPFCQLCDGDLHCQMAFECTDCEYYICYLCGLRCQDFGSSIPDKTELILADASNSVSEDKVEAQISINLPADNVVVMVEQFLKHRGFTRSGLAAEISHFSHKHHLNLSTDHPEDVNILNSEEILTCYGCGRPISTPYYFCMECNYFLHACCAQLPDKIQLQIYSSKVFTLSMPSKSLSGCGFCYDTRGGFFFKRDQNFLDIDCAILNSSYTVIKHEAHPHPLVPTDVNRSGVFCCIGCACFIKSKYALSCADCGFYLHFRCAKLPRVFSDVEFHKHPLMLRCRYSANQYPKVVYCEQCKKKIYTISWFYYCSECHQSFHPYCSRYSVTSAGDGSETED